MKTVARWVFLGVCWTVLLFLGACFAIMLPLNLVLIPCWIAMASSVGSLARTLFGEPNVPQPVTDEREEIAADDAHATRSVTRASAAA